MQQLLKIIESLRRENPLITSEELINFSREYLQIVILEGIYHSKFGRFLSFMGGTCLRLCHNLKRYSEDLDFTLDVKSGEYDFKNLNLIVQQDLVSRNIKNEINVSQDKIVQKTFIRIVDILDLLGLSRVKGQRLHIKLEVDTNPVDIKFGKRESFFITKYNEIFPILKHDLPTLFAGKILAILNRPYRRGRDFYDLIWYLSQKVNINITYLNEGMKQCRLKEKFSDEEEIFERIEGIVSQIESDFILKDISRFLEDPNDITWIKNYKQVFLQLKNSNLKKP